MNVLLDLAISTLTQGLIYALLSYGVYITYKILDFPDLTVDGSFPLGAAVTAVLLTRGADPYLTLLVAIAIGALAGLVTGLIHVRLHVRDLLAGIITMTALFSINLQIAGSNMTVERTASTIFTAGPVMALLGVLPLIYRKLIVSLLIALSSNLSWTCTSRPRTAAAAGCRRQQRSGHIAGQGQGTGQNHRLVIANALVALSGAIGCHEQRAFSSTMGTGQVVFGLATVIIGTTLFRSMGFVKGTTAVLVGSILYKGCIQIAISIGLPANLLKLVTAVLFLGFWSSATPGREGQGPCLSSKTSPRSTTPAPSRKCACSRISTDGGRGEFLSIVGSNGSGKTSPSEHHLRQYPDEGGDVLIGGESIARPAGLPRYDRIGRVYQNPAMGTCPSLTILENMSLADNKGRRYNLTPDQQEAPILLPRAARLAGLGLEDKLDVKLESLSGGQRQAVALIMATLTRSTFSFWMSTRRPSIQTAETIMVLTDKSSGKSI
jgi:putative ABC transport system permease protein